MLTRARIRVLLAEDHAVVREGIRRALEEQPDIQVVGEAADGEEAVRQTQALLPDVVLMDIAMPRLNGVEATRQIKALAPSTAVLVLSAYDDDAYVRSILQAGASGYLLKNCRTAELLTALRTVNRGERVVTPVAPLVTPQADRHARPSLRQAQAEPLLTRREAEVLAIAARGLSNKGIARELGVSPRTVQTHLSSIFAKLDVNSRTEAIIAAMRLGIISSGMPERGQGGHPIP